MEIKKFIIEIATSDYRTVQAAVAGGADRIELCSALSEGGLTPSFGLVQQCRKDFEIPLFPILRPRSGDFLYTEEEFSIILKDALLCKQEGCDGVVVGFLNKDGSIDKKRTEKIVAAVYPLEVTFHRAFDRCVDPLNAMEDIINAGCQRILTSGQQHTAIEGINLIKELVAAANDRIIIMPGSGVRTDNVKNLADVTGATEFHSSLKTKTKSSMDFIHPSFAGSEESYLLDAVDPDSVRAFKLALMV